MGLSVARLRLARLSMIRFTHSICTAVSGLSCGERQRVRSAIGFGWCDRMV